MCDCDVCTEIRRLREIKNLIPHKEDREYFEDFVDKYLDICMELDFYMFDTKEIQNYTKEFLGEEKYEEFKEFVWAKKKLF